MMEVKSIETNLSVTVVEDDVIANILFLNTTSDLIHLDALTIGVTGRLTREVFVISDENNREVIYSGVMASRRITPDDFIELKPGESINTKIVISKDYKLIKGHNYNIRFDVINPSLPDKPIRMELTSNTVEFMY